jgi:hypothetical protein
VAYWWVSQNKTWKEEHQGGYLWAPVQNARGQTFFHWENMQRVAEGDQIFSYVGGDIVALAVAETEAYRHEKPFSSRAGEAWEREGWRIDVTYDFIEPPISVADIYDELMPVMPSKYGPLNTARGGNVGYLFELSAQAADQLLRRAGYGPTSVIRHHDDDGPPPAKPREVDSLADILSTKRPAPGGRGTGAAFPGANRRSGRAKEIGDKAEALVLKWLRDTLPEDQAETLVWEADEGRKPGWDIQYEADGEVIGIEVKGTTRSEFPAFEVSANEWEAAKKLRGRFRLVLVARCESDRPRIHVIEDPWRLTLEGDLEAAPLAWRVART